MLDAVSPQQFDEWEAYQRLEPDKLDRIRIIITNGLSALCRSWGSDITPEILDPFLGEETAQTVTPEQAQAMMRAAYAG